MMHPNEFKNIKVAKKNNHTRIMIFGTFDMVHEGHKHLFKQARALVENPFLIVSIARDSNVERIKGRRPRHTQSERQKLVAKAVGVDKVVLGAVGDPIPHIGKEKPDIIALGYDQTAYVRGLRSSLKQAGLKTKVIRLKPHKSHLYKTSLILRSVSKSITSPTKIKPLK